MSLELVTTPLDKFKIASKLLQATKAAYHLLKLSIYDNKDKALCMVCMVNDTKMTSIS